MYLCVTWLSKICPIEGTSLLNGLEYDDVDLPHENVVTRPAQNKANKISWALWDRLLCQFTLPNESTLKEPL